MPTQRFTLIVEGADLQSEPLIDQLFEAGCGDATFGRSDGVQYVDFDREAASLGAALLSAVWDLEQFEGVHVTGMIDLEPAPVDDIAVTAEGAFASVGALGGAEHQLGELPSSALHPRNRERLGPWAGFTHASPPGSDRKTPSPVPQSTSAWNLISIVRASLRPDQATYGHPAMDSGSGLTL